MLDKIPPVFVIVDEIKKADSTLQEYLIKSLREIMISPSFKGSIPEHLVQSWSIANELFQKYCT
ncbi:TPA: hypothetical protein ACG3NF_001494 [Legionella pneumophila]|uniref:hypothetical protein n=1 Tax=Legionella pneumophila TaxID=446 RepID=UPI00058BD034|nr:hypothetical protein [Legionella pneumophila]HAT9272594.1 hypothetical protein [Legionella pneumophila subsp. pneumophila]MCO1452384.1 hypothetical protein [Legionella pneumophila]MCZ4722584.1 hypothetical protein [Legionella pneumophila]MCZ4729485.1 hypothetical protein [Legionella pneumophila]MCZ4734380.1 hypothetical protein [Legionella pneumophila]